MKSPDPPQPTYQELQQQLQDSEERFRSLCALSSDWYWEQDAEFRFTRFFSNARTPPWMVARADGDIGRRRWELEGCEPATGTWADHEATLRAHRPFTDFEYRNHGNGRRVIVSGEPVFDRRGGFVGYRGTARDVAGTREMESRLRQAQALMAMAMQLGRIGAWSWCPGDARLMCTDDIALVMGRTPPFAPTPEEAIGVYAPEYQPRLRALVEECIRSGSPFELEAEICASDASRRWVRVLCEAEWNAAGRVIRIYGAIQDISESRFAQAELRESQRMLAGLMANLPGMAYRAHNAPDWPLTFASQGSLPLTGCTPQQLIEGRPRYGELIHPDDREEIWQTVQRAIAARTQFQLTYRLQVQGTEKWVWEQGAGVYESDGSLRCIEGLITDVTLARRAQMQVAQLNEHLEQRVRERTEQLEHANAELEAFAYSVAHDLRAPMTALDGFARLLSRDVKNLEPLHTHYLRRISDNVRHMSELTDALLSLSHLSAVDLVRRPVDLAVLARRVVEQLREADPDRIAEIEIAPALPTHGDERLLQQALANLLGNAWKFSRGKPVTRIRFGARMEAAGFVVYSVEDEGAGFDMRHAGNLFTAFHRMHSASEFEGTGIGLAIVRKVISRHGGRVWAESMPGEGTRVSFTLRPG